MNFIRIFGSTNQSSTNSPNRLIRNNNILHLLLRNTNKILRKLHGTNLILNLEIILLLRLTNTKNRLHPHVQHLPNLAVNRIITVTEQRPTFRMSTEDVLTTDAFNHASGDASGVGALILEEDGLCTDGDANVFDNLFDFREEWVWREDDDFGTEVIFFVHGASFFSEEFGEAGGKCDGFVFSSWVHFPVSCHYWLPRLELRRGDDWGILWYN
mmetsp:Transcript_1367/g.1993  ORF Transcript_1367/g.1993 Transcript_1367/m.1993 type:complete len:213 (-) Transcript_1367:176-814(-)